MDRTEATQYTILGSLLPVDGGELAKGETEITGIGPLPMECKPAGEGYYSLTVGPLAGTLTRKIAKNARSYYAGKLSVTGSSEYFAVTLWPQPNGSYSLSARTADVVWVGDLLNSPESFHQHPF